MAHAEGDLQPADLAQSVTGGSRWGHYAALFAAVVVGLLLRSAWFSTTFQSDGSVLLGVDDSMFHARRALFSFFNFPQVLEFDWYIAYPQGAPAPLPPLFDWLLAGVARLFGDDLRSFEIVAAWVSPVLGALLAVTAFWIGRSIAGPGLGVAAAGLVAVLPSGILMTRLGNCDHHSAVALIAACWLASSLRASSLSAPGSRDDPSGRAGAIHSQTLVHTLVHAIVITSMLLTWSGSLLYLALGEGARIAAMILFDSRPERFARAGASLAIAALPVGAWLLISEAPLGGPLSSQTLSWLHEIALLAIAGYALALGLLERWRPAVGPGSRLGRALLLATFAALPALLVPAIREAAWLGVGFVGKQDLWAASNPEQTALFTSNPHARVKPPTTRFGLFAYLVPLTPFVIAYGLARVRKPLRERYFVLLCWVTALSGLVLSQVRYGTDYTVPGAVAFALALAGVRVQFARFARRMPSTLATGVVVALAGALLWPAWQYHATGLSNSWRHWFSPQAARETPIKFRFADEIRRVTPETRGFLDGERPEYGLLVPPNLGHLFAYRARRPVPANNLGPYLELSLYQDANDFYQTVLAAPRGIEILERVHARYVVTTNRGPPTRSFANALHRTNGSGQEPTGGRLRLITLSPPGGAPSAGNPPGDWRGLPTFKLFEFVNGAVLVVPAGAGELVRAQISLGTPAGPLRFVQSARGGPHGVARLRVPYPSASHAINSGRVAVRSNWLVRAGQATVRVEVREEDVREGRDIIVRLPGGRSER